MHGGGACMAGGCAWWGCAWLGACMVGGMHGGGACVTCTATAYGQSAGGTHPTGMHSCC